MIKRNEIIFLLLIFINLSVNSKVRIVTSTEDDKNNPTAGMLRYILGNISLNDSVIFSVATVNLDTTLDLISDKITIDGGINGVDIIGKETFNVFYITTEEGDFISLNKLNFKNGKTGLYLDMSKGGNIRITSCSFINNHTLSSGGGLHIKPNFIKENNCIVKNSLFAENSAYRGGAFFSQASWGSASKFVYGNVFINCTFSKNIASSEGGAIYASGENFFLNCIIYDNLDPESESANGGNYENCAVQNSVYSDFYNKFLYGDNNIFLYSSPFVETGYSLNSSSYCANVGDLKNFEIPTTDLAGNQRIINGQIDLGAFESKYEATPHELYSNITVTNNKFDVDVPNSFLWAMHHADTNCTITFDSSYNISVLQPIILYNDITINGGKNKVTFDGGDSTAIFIAQGYPRLTLKNLIIQNGYGISGGGLYIDNCLNNSYISNCIFQNNTAINYGGGVYNRCSNFINCVFKDNFARLGGGIYANGINDYTNIVNCNIINNVATYEGGGVYNREQNRFQNCIIYNNRSPQGSNIYMFGSEKPIMLNCASSSDLGDTNISLVLSPFQSSTSNSLFELNKESGCINAGTIETLKINLPNEDLNGNQRIVGDKIDIGASEYYEFMINTKISKGTGKIIPSFANVLKGDTQIFDIKPAKGFSTDFLLIDGVYKDSINSVLFENINANHFIEVFFTIDTFTVYTKIQGKGSITPVNPRLTVLDSVNFLITPDNGWNIDELVYGGVSVLDSIINKENSSVYILNKVSKIDTFFVSFTQTINNQLSRDMLDVSVYPNPTNGILKFSKPQDLNNCELSLCDMYGRVLIYYPNFNKQNINIASFTEGLYFIKIKIADNYYVKRIIKY